MALLPYRPRLWFFGPKEEDMGVGIVPLQSVQEEVAKGSLVRWWIEGDFTADRAACLAELDRLARTQ